MYPQGMGKKRFLVKKIANSNKPLPPFDPFEEIYRAWSLSLKC